MIECILQFARLWFVACLWLLDPCKNIKVGLEYKNRLKLLACICVSTGLDFVTVFYLEKRVQICVKPILDKDDGVNEALGTGCVCSIAS